MHFSLLYRHRQVVMWLSSLLLVLLGCRQPVAAQAVWPATTPDNYFAQAPDILGVQNTGMGLCTDTKGRRLNVMTWDGDKPSFGWSFDGRPQRYQPLDGIRLGYQLRDPDIIAYGSPQGELFMMAVYQARPSANDPYSVRFEMQRYDPATDSWQVTHTSTRISGYSSCDATSPNVDINYRTGDAVLVFELAGSIQVASVNVVTRQYSGLHSVACNVVTSLQDCTGGSTLQAHTTHRDPDIAIWGDNYNPTPAAPDLVSITYVTQVTTNTQTTLQVDLQQVELATLLASPNCSLPAPQLALGPLPATDVLEQPRIAANDDIAPYTDPYDCAVAVHHADGSGDHIYTLCRRQATFGNQIDAQVQNDPSVTSEDARPVINYANDFLILLWQARTNFSTNVVAKQLAWTGQPTNSTLFEVNIRTKGTQGIPCLETRNYTGGRGGYGLSAFGFAGWYDAYSRDAATKLFQADNMVFRAGVTPAATPVSASLSAAELAVLPTPATAGARLHVQLPDDEHAQRLLLLEAGTGRTIATLPTAGLASGKSADLALPTLAEGLYLACLVTDRGTRYVRFSYQP